MLALLRKAEWGFNGETGCPWCSRLESDGEHALLYRVYGEHGKWGRRHRNLDKRRRIAARLAEVQRRTTTTAEFAVAK